MATPIKECAYMPVRCDPRLKLELEARAKAAGLSREKYIIAVLSAHLRKGGRPDKTA
jgi:predicted HicB family RNase H-like nuclease